MEIHENMEAAHEGTEAHDAPGAARALPCPGRVASRCRGKAWVRVEGRGIASAGAALLGVVLMIYEGNAS
jgi:hypothetical protein